MSYFTENFELFAETKNQVLAGYERNISHSRQSNDWHRRNDTKGKGRKIEYGPSYSGKPGTKKFEKNKEEAEKAMKPMRTAEDYYRREKLFGKDAKDGDRADRDTEKYRKFVSKHSWAQKAARNRKSNTSCKESTFLKEGYDAVDESFDMLMEAAFCAALNVLNAAGYDTEDDSIQEYAFETAYNTLVE